MRAPRGIRILLWTVLVIVLAGGAGIAVLLTVPAPLERWLQGRILLALRQHYRADVQLQNLQVTLIPAFGATADNFVLPHRGSPGLPPVITVKHIEARAALVQLLRSPIHLSWLRLEGMVIQVGGNRKGQRPSALAPPSKPEHQMRLANFVIDKVEADGAELYVLRKDPTREPLQWGLRKLSLRSAGVGQPMTFTAELTNPTPPGLIETQGKFGPWNFDEPSGTKVSGHYSFQHADLSVFNGIAGILSSTGDYQGALHNIIVDGATDVPDFELDRGGEPVHLTTQFHAIVDGTNGNTYLQPVKAHFRSTDIVTNGEVARSPGQKGKSITLDVKIEQGQVQDVLALAAKSGPPALTGRLALTTKLLLPPGKEPVLQKMLLRGSCNVSGARFNNEKVNNAIAALSRRGQGKPNDPSISDVPANFAGDFSLGRETLRFSRLQFVVPGAVAQMKGSYGLRTEAVDFQGDVRLEATVSQTMKGSKRWLLRPFDPIFMKHGAGTYLPVAITGTRTQPDVKLQWKKLF